MKLTIFTDAWYPQINGVVTTLDMTKQTLEKRGWEVEIVHPDMYRFTIPLQPSTGIFMPLLPMGIADGHVRNADKIHIATEGAIGLAARYSCKKHGKSYTTSFHTKYPEYVKIHTGISPRVSSKYFRWFHRNSNCVMVTTPQMVDYCSQLGIKRLKIWSRGVDTELFKPDPNWKSKGDGIRAIYVGRVSAEKNLEAFLNISNDNIIKFVVGDGPQLEEYRSKYQDTYFLGRKTREEIAKLLQVQDVFAWSSLTDTFGLVVLEAMACGLPVAGFDNEINRYIVDDKSAVLTSKSLEHAIKSASLLNRDNAVARAKKFSWEAATDQFIENLA